MNKVNHNMSFNLKYYLYHLFLLKWCVNGACVDDPRALLPTGKI